MLDSVCNVTESPGLRSCLNSLTQFLQGGDPELVVVFVRQRCSAFSHDLSRDGLCRHLHRLHVTNEGLEPLVGERRLTPIQLYDPAGREGDIKVFIHAGLKGLYFRSTFGFLLGESQLATESWS